MVSSDVTLPKKVAFCRLDAPFGTEDNPVVVPSEYEERIVGVVDPDDDSLVGAGFFGLFSGFGWHVGSVACFVWGLSTRTTVRW
jgi:hypothetical protein